MSTFDHEPAAHAVIQLLDDLTDQDLSRPTPCPGMPVAALLDHLLGLSLAFTWAADKTGPPEGGPAPGPGGSKAENLDPDWRRLLPERLQALVGAWRNPAAWAGTTEAGGIRLPAEVAAVVAVDELVLHGWDLARAIGRPYPADPATTAVIMEFLAQSARPEQAQMRAGLFGPVIELPEDAPAFDRALGLAGRDPAWTADPAAIVRRLFDAYLAQDRPATERLIADGFVFTSPQDDHIDRDTYFQKCFPTADRVRRQDLLRTAVTGDDVFVLYEYELLTGAVHRNAELLTVRDALVVETQVFFGGRYRPATPPDPGTR